MRMGVRLNPDAHRVIAKLFVPGEETPGSRSRANAVIARILALDEAEVTTLIDEVVADYDGRHRDLTTTFAYHFDVVSHEIPSTVWISPQRRMLIGSCFTHEYSPEAAALCNPSVVAHPDQSGLVDGQLRFVMTVRCVGEGHISSIGFRTGIVGPGDALVVDEPEPLLVTGVSRPSTYERRLFLNRLADLGSDDHDADILIGGLPESFTTGDLEKALSRVHDHTLNREMVHRTVSFVHQIAAATYDVEFPADAPLSGRILWPYAPMESHGMEDARLTKFTEDDGSVTYYATYTAYDGVDVATHLLETRDFRTFHLSPMAGQGAQGKGLALFPRRIRGRYVALSRWDRESTALVGSDNLRIWGVPTTLHAPRRGWELIQVGNCGSPVETAEGWLVLTHGVGPMREYSLGAMLLDLADPSVVLATLPDPLLTPNHSERDGYVPNVVYSCGPLLHDGLLTIPYGISDGAIGFAQVALDKLLGRMTSP